MSLQALFSNASKLARFEQIARDNDYTNFNKRGGFYCLSALNDFAAGYVAGLNASLKELNNVESMDPLRIDGEPTEEQRAAFAVDASRFKVEAAA